MIGIGTRISEVQERTKPCDWYWTSSGENIADWLSRGKSPSELGKNSIWQNGPQFVQLPEREWPIKQSHNILEIPELIRSVMKTKVEEIESLAQRINIDRYSSYYKLIRVTCRIISCYKRLPSLSFRNI